MVLDRRYWWIVFLSALSSEMVCVCCETTLGVVCDQINAKEKGLKAILANQICYTSLDKKNRRLVGAFLALVADRGLSFKLLRIAEVGVRLPIQCVSLTIAYVIILLQFGKLAENHLMS